MGNNVIYLTLSGSYAYGTDTANCDIDVREITIENKEEVLGLSNFEQYEDILRINEYDKLIRDDSGVFLSKRVINIFGNHASYKNFNSRNRNTKWEWYYNL